MGSERMKVVPGCWKSYPFFRFDTFTLMTGKVTKSIFHPKDILLEKTTPGKSKNEEIHDNVIGMYINRYYFTGGCYLESV
jgi:hypothetical protein